MELHYIARNELSKYWETKSICIEFADGSDALAAGEWLYLRRVFADGRCKILFGLGGKQNAICSTNGRS